MKFNIVTLPGDGIGPDIVEQAILVLHRIGKRFGHDFEIKEMLAGGCAIDALGVPLPKETLLECKNSDSVLLGAVGGPKWDHLEGKFRPEQALLGLRGELNLFANLRPVNLFSQLKDACPLKPEIIGDSLDILIVRELTGGIYFGKRKTEETKAFDTMSYTEDEIKRVLIVGFETALKRNKKVTVVDKANILDTSRLWRKVTERVKINYPGVELNYLYVDNAAMQLIKNPKQFDVIITENMFGDILSDEASMLTGSIGMLSSASLSDNKIGMYEPIHGSAPDIAGCDLANPIATIMSLKMMLEYSFDLKEEALLIENAVNSVLSDGFRTADIYKEGMKKVGTKEMGQLIADRI